MLTFHVEKVDADSILLPGVVLLLLNSTLITPKILIEKKLFKDLIVVPVETQKLG